MEADVGQEPSKEKSCHSLCDCNYFHTQSDVQRLEPFVIYLMTMPI
jgi:hypothetical protein